MAWHCPVADAIIAASPIHAGAHSGEASGEGACVCVGTAGGAALRRCLLDLECVADITTALSSIASRPPPSAYLARLHTLVEDVARAASPAAAMLSGQADTAADGGASRGLQDAHAALLEALCECMCVAASRKGGHLWYRVGAADCELWRQQDASLRAPCAGPARHEAGDARLVSVWSSGLFSDLAARVWPGAHALAAAMHTLSHAYAHAAARGASAGVSEPETEGTWLGVPISASRAAQTLAYWRNVSRHVAELGAGTGVTALLVAASSRSHDAEDALRHSGIQRWLVTDGVPGPAGVQRCYNNVAECTSETLKLQGTRLLPAVWRWGVDDADHGRCTVAGMSRAEAAASTPEVCASPHDGTEACEFNLRTCTLAVGADLVYDPGDAPLLAATLRTFLQLGRPPIAMPTPAACNTGTAREAGTCRVPALFDLLRRLPPRAALIATTIRKPETYETFVSACAEAGLHYEDATDGIQCLQERLLSEGCALLSRTFTSLGAAAHQCQRGHPGSSAARRACTCTAELKISNANGWNTRIALITENNVVR